MRLMLEEFAEHPVAAPRSPAAAGQGDRDAAFEDGYKAGWEDAVNAEDATHRRVSADFEKALSDLSFTFFEARGHILKELTPLFMLIVEKIVPDLAGHTFPQTLAAMLEDVAAQTADAPLRLCVNPENMPAVRSVMPDTPPFPLELAADPTLGPGQALIRAGDTQDLIDFDTVQAGIRDAVLAFLTPTMDEKERRHA